MIRDMEVTPALTPTQLSSSGDNGTTSADLTAAAAAATTTTSNQFAARQSLTGRGSRGDITAQPQPQHQQHSGSISSSSSSMLTNSYASPSSSLTSIPSNSPTSTNFSLNLASDCCCTTINPSVASATLKDRTATNSLEVEASADEAAAAAAAATAAAARLSLDEEQPTKTEPLVINSLRDASCATQPSPVASGQSGCDAVGMEAARLAVATGLERAATAACQPTDASMASGGGCDALADTYNITSALDEQLPSGSPAMVHSELLGCDESMANIVETARLERSNSCSQADAVACSIELMAPDAAAAAKSMLFGTTTSLSHEDLSQASKLTAASAYDGAALISPPLLDAPASESLIDPAARLFECTSSEQSRPTIVDTASDAGHETNAAAATNLLLKNNNNSSNVVDVSQSLPNTSRFFSSKLNTGSLWSLLSVGSNSSASTSNAQNEIMTSIDNPAAATRDSPRANHKQPESDLAQNDKQQQTSNERQMIVGQDKNFKSSISAGFFNRVQQFKRQHSGQEQQQPNHRQQAVQKPSSSSSSIDDASFYRDVTLNEPNRIGMKRFRFSVKYIGSAMLHKNFTLPMLEWIARDIKRQTVKGAQSTNQRQFSIPARDIILEIQSYQLMATSCKDGHCIFVHPMHCVSKYAQLQHDPNCFSYLIRDTKESPYFCHVFQAKSTHKVHEIFSAIREATTTQISQPMTLRPTHAAAATADQQRQSAAGDRDMMMSPRIQKSASTDGQLRNVSSSGPSSSNSKVDARAILSLATSQAQTSLMTTNNSNAIFTSQRAALIRPTESQPTSQSFENSYQFEVMFVKKVKLQCRRVPASFVDDALETLKSFDVLKGGDSKAQIKGIGKRIISASVDERQEYDEACQSPTLQGAKSKQDQASLIGGGADSLDQRRGSSASLNRGNQSMSIKEERESRSCQQSPTKAMPAGDGSRAAATTESELKVHHQSTGCLDNIGSTIIRSARAGQAPHYFNDFSPYNTITSNDLNERIAAMPVVSGSVSLDHETRQKLARQVRETIMATAANIKKDVYASGDKLDAASSSFKVLDSLSCTAMSSVPSIEDQQQSSLDSDNQPSPADNGLSDKSEATAAAAGQSPTSEQRRSSTGPFVQPTAQTANNFDLFRRASARQVVKNRTMLLLIGKDELCTISIDKHQVLFSKSFSSIVHCLQGNNNRDHFGLICRDSGKINPNTEAYAGLIFKCQSEKVVREIMGALKQVIYNSQHNYHGYNSIYNPLNAVVQYNAVGKSHSSPKLERAAHQTATTTTTTTTPTTAAAASITTTLAGPSYQTANLANTNKNLELSMEQANKSLAAKRGFVNHLEFDSASNTAQQASSDHHIAPSTAPSTASVLAQTGPSAASTAKAQPPPKNLIRSMFCDNCPLYWYHRLCCDIESLPAEASKSIILRRIDSSLAEKEQDELYSKFSDFNIESIDEHNEIFMSLLRLISERNQLRHNQTQAHQAAIAKNNPSTVKQQSALASFVSRQPSSAQTPTSIVSNSSIASAFSRAGGHQRSGSSGGSLGFVLGQSSNQSISDAGNMAMDNLKRAKNNLSVSIENMLKRRSSAARDESDEQQVNNPDSRQMIRPSSGFNYLPSRSGSFRSATRESRAVESVAAVTTSSNNAKDGTANLKRSSSTSDYSTANQSTSSNSIVSWRDSFSRTINDDLTNPLMGLFRRRSSTFGTKNGDSEDVEQPAKQLGDSSQRNRASLDSLNKAEVLHHNVTPQHQPASPNGVAAAATESRFLFGSNVNGGSSPSSMLSSAFWKKSIFDKIRQPQSDVNPSSAQVDTSATNESEPISPKIDDSRATATANSLEPITMSGQTRSAARTRDELRALWRKAILEQITLLKMDKQNQRLQANSTECDIQRIKLNYKDVPHKRDALASWGRLLKQDPTKKVEFVEVARLVRYGVPKQRRGEVWMFLMNQYQLRHGTSFQPSDSEYHGDANQTYRSLLSQLSTQQHEIFVDIGRTFPTHPYYSQYLSIGQLSLFNLLKAYSLLDQEVGYCQGLSFVAGILLLHVDSEDEAFELMRHLLFNFGLRKQYLPSMNALHLQLYQITRLLRDYEFEVFNHFDRCDISPSLYAAPWFLTLFASQFPLGFVARLLDLIFLMGIEAIFRVSLNLLAYHKVAILERKSLESTMDFMRNNLVIIDDKNLAMIFDKSMSMDLRNKLIEYEIEYTFYCAEDKARSATRYPPTSQNMSPSSRDNRNENGQDGVESASESLIESTSKVADATATVIIQHLLANNHLKSLQTNYSY